MYCFLYELFFRLLDISAFFFRDGDFFRRFCKDLHQQVADLHLWSASITNDDIPPELREVRLTEPLRTPPSVTREVQQAVGRYSDIPDYTNPAAPLPCDGPGVRVVDHGALGHPGGTDDCEQCGQLVGDMLRQLIGTGDVGRVSMSYTFCLCPRASMPVL